MCLNLKLVMNAMFLSSRLRSLWRIADTLNQLDKISLIKSFGLDFGICNVTTTEFVRFRTGTSVASSNIMALQSNANDSLWFQNYHAVIAMAPLNDEVVTNLNKAPGDADDGMISSRILCRISAASGQCIVINWFIIPVYRTWKCNHIVPKLITIFILSDH